MSTLTYHPAPQEGQEPVSVTHPAMNGSTNADSRRNSLSENPGAAPDASAPPMSDAAGAAAVQGEAFKPVVPDGDSETGKTVAFNEPAHATYTGHDVKKKRGWSRGKKICCCICLLFTAVLITMAVLIAFMVRTPTIDYDSVQIICANNAYLTCAQNTVQILVTLNVNNPNILGATINARLGLYKTDGTYLGPGTVDDTYVAKNSVTKAQALFTVTSGKGYDVLVALYVPPTHSVDVVVKGTVYVHVGLLRPSMQFEKTVTIPPQSATGLLGSLGGSIPSVPSIPSIPSIPSVGLYVVPAEDTAATDAPLQSSSSFSTPANPLRLSTRASAVDPALFAKALVAVGPPHSARRKAMQSQGSLAKGGMDSRTKLARKILQWT
jgi:hypothetical protein